MYRYVKIMMGTRPGAFREKKEDERELENRSSQPTGKSSSPCLRNIDHCCKQACCCRYNGAICMQLYCPCGSLRSDCRRMRLCGGPDPDPDIEALQPCRDRRCYHCFGPNYYSDGEDEFSEESFSEEEEEEEEEEEDSGFDEMD